MSSLIRFAFLVEMLFLETSAQPINITIGIIIANGSILPYGLHRSGPAVYMGIRHLRQTLSVEANIKVMVSVTEPTCVANDVGAIAADMYYVHGVSAFFGPACNEGMEVVGRLASFWNHPVIAPIGTGADLNDKADFKTLTRMTYNYKQLAGFYMLLFQNYNWTDITVIYDVKNYTSSVSILNKLTAESLHTDFLNAGLTSNLRMFTSESNSDKDFENVLRLARTTSRVIVLACDGKALRKMMLMAQSLGMTGGDYAYVYYYAFKGDILGEVNWNQNDKNDQRAKSAFESLLIVSLYMPESQKFDMFKSHVKNQSLQTYNFSYDAVDYDVNPYVAAFYDAFVIYATVLKQTIDTGDDYMDGQIFTCRIHNQTFNGVSGKIKFNGNGERQSDFMLLDMDKVSGNFQIVATLFGAEGYFTFRNNTEIHWPNNYGPPENKPRCGFNGDAPECIDTEFPLVGIISIAFSGILLILSVAGIVVYRKMRKESEIYSNWWRIDWDDIDWVSVGKSKASSVMGMIPNSNMKSTFDVKSFLEEMNYRQEAKMASYKGSKVSICQFKVQGLNTTREVLLELLQLRNVNCNNLTKFIGLTHKSSILYAINEYCTRGNLQDILRNDSFKLNWDFRASLICDVIQALHYLHNSEIRYHGKLTSEKCVIDSRFVLKVDEFGIHTLRKNSLEKETDFFWIAPEILRKSTETANYHELQQADVYSFGIILYEILSRKEPFQDDREYLSLDEIRNKLIYREETAFRPQLVLFDVDKNMAKLMKWCWEENPKSRPNFSTIKKEAKQMNWDKSGDKFLDNLLNRMEEYANNLENLVDERTQAFLDEKRRSEELLYQVIPKSVADELRNGRSVYPESYECVTVYFSDIFGFTEISSQSSPMQIVDLLNDVYTCFDKIIEPLDVYKVETIGDAYMVVSGLPIRNGNQHVIQISKMAVSILKTAKSFTIKHLPTVPLRARIGIHSGPVCAGVVGRKMPRYCLFGDTVNTASRMESNGEALKIHVSMDTRNLLVHCADFQLEHRGEIPIKGKGIMSTFWLTNATDIKCSGSP